MAEDQWGLMTTAQAADAGLAWSTMSRMVRVGALVRVSHGVYRVHGAGEPEQLDLRAAWLQLAPHTPAWERGPDDGVVSHRSAADLYRLGDLPADRHEFTLSKRRQSRRTDVRLHRGPLEEGDWRRLRGLLVTRPARTAADLLAAREDPGAVGLVVADSIRSGSDDPSSIAAALAPRAAGLGLPAGDGSGLLRWLVDLTGDPDRDSWLDEIRG